MSNFLKLQTTDFKDGEIKFPAPERRIDGNPQTTVWNQFSGVKGEVRVGVADSTPGTTRCIKGDSCEIIHILDGAMELTEDEGEPVNLGKGDIFVLKPGFTGTWKTVETVRKAFVLLT
jgi:uncharacterized cupin superfamily protein